MKWYRNLRIVQSVEDKLPFLEQPISAMPVPPAGQVLPSDVLNTHNAWVKASKEIAGLMLMIIDPDIQRNLEHLGAYDMLKELKTLYVQQADRELLQTEEWNQGKGKAKKGYAPVQAPPYAPKPKNPPTPKKDNPGKDTIGHQCGEVGHWRRNCPIYLTELMKKKLSQGASTSGSQGNNKKVKLNLDFALLWHCRLGHISNKRIDKLQHDGFLDSTDIKSFEKCVSWMSEKMARKPYSHQVERAKDLLRLIHTDVCGPFKIMSRQGAYYFLTFTDEFSRYGYVYLLKHKHEVFDIFKVFLKEVEDQLGKTIKSLCSDRGGEYMSQEFLDHLKEREIIAHRTPLYTPRHNSVSDRRNRTLLDMVRSMMSQTTLPKSFWDYALESAARILNMAPTKKVDKTPYERDTLTKPDKLEPRSIKCIFVEYLKQTIRYSCYYPPENKVFVARNSEFLENSIITQKAGESLEDLEIIQEEYTYPSVDTSLYHEENDKEIDEPQSDINLIRRSTRTRRAPDRMCLYIDAEEHELGDLVDLPPNGKTVGHKWLFKKKTDMDEAVHTYKARLVAKGFTQTSEIDYEKTFSSVTDIRAIRILIAIATFYDYEISKIDVKTAFLNGYLNEKVYMEQPKGFVSQKFQNRVCKLKRSIYELKQASRQQNKRFDDEIKKFRFSQNRDEPCVYVKASGIYVTFLILYVDDILIMGNNILMLQDVKSYLGNLGEAAYILRIKIYRDRSKRLIGLCDTKQELRVSCCTDAGYLTDAEDMKSQSGYVFVLNGGAVD
uniref:Retrotransposon protein, putative, Ty1-copia subclass n=1 Tax=Tanacetum cinerariifolium TaxID=118510 RepID=A0A6L2KLR7_TANCI|nr:retrotransposon protein, putative, Ty1-copia subclass [Tanacetum cinerariifolium]